MVDEFLLFFKAGWKGAGNLTIAFPAISWGVIIDRWVREDFRRGEEGTASVGE